MTHRRPDFESRRISVVIPALNEEQGLAQVLPKIPSWVNEVIVADNGSTDRTAQVAASAGARVIHEPQRGYGKACLTALAACRHPDVVVFLDADASDDPTVMDRLVEPILLDRADFVLGSRTAGLAQPGSLTLPQRFGNALACRLMRWLYGVRYTDLGPFRAIRNDCLQALAMNDENYGWTIQMQIRAARHNLRIMEIPVPYARRIGRSKVSGTVRGVIGAGTKILYTVFKELTYRPGKARRTRLHGTTLPVPTSTGRLVIVMTRYPRPGRTKTRLIEHLGPEGAADLHRRLLAHTLAQARQLTDCSLLVFYADAQPEEMARLCGHDLLYLPQGRGNIGRRMADAFDHAFKQGFHRVLLVGTDIPGLTSRLLHQALSDLDHHDVVLGPAEDGGYYLIGMKRFHSVLFERIPWGTDAVADQTLQRAASAGLSVAQIAPLADIDRPQDLARMDNHPPVP